MIFNKHRNLLIILIIWRLISVWVVQTSHVPDEYWQSLEVAHHLTFGYGYLTWEWTSMIRSYIYPFMISILYRILAFFHLDSTSLLVTLPRIFHAILSGYADYRFYLWTKSKWATFFLAINWYWYYCATRTLTNTLETSLTIIALSIFPWKDESKNSESSKFLWIVGFMSAIRPTMAITWTPLCFYHIFTSRKSFIKLFFEYSIVIISTLIYSILIDSFCYGQLAITPWEFFRINVINNISDFYGKHHFLWYLTVGLPVIAGFHAFCLPLVAYQIIKNFGNMPRPTISLITIFWTIASYSLLVHKEFRFILPILPMIIYICTCTTYPNNLKLSGLTRKLLLILVIAMNFLPALYLSIVHQRGPLDVMKILEKELSIDNSSHINIMFLTPCHATPLYSHLHKNIPVRFLTCEPNLSNQENYLDEADQFFHDPGNWLSQNFVDKKLMLPSILVLYDNIVNVISDVLENYQPIAKVFNAHIPQSNYGQYIFVYKHKSLS